MCYIEHIIPFLLEFCISSEGWPHRINPVRTDRGVKQVITITCGCDPSGMSMLLLEGQMSLTSPGLQRMHSVRFYRS
jgi:hypothetical protein